MNLLGLYKYQYLSLIRTRFKIIGFEFFFAILSVKTQRLFAVNFLPQSYTKKAQRGAEKT